MKHIHIKAQSAGALTESEVVVMPTAARKALTWCVANVATLEPEHGVSVIMRAVP
jgi:hypothetical protein